MSFETEKLDSRRSSLQPLVYKSFSLFSMSLPLLSLQIGVNVAEMSWAASWQNQQNGMCAQWRLRLACASAQSDRSLRCPHEESSGPWLPIECTAKTWSDWVDTQADPSLRWAHVILLVLSGGGSVNSELHKLFKQEVFSHEKHQLSD